MLNLIVLNSNMLNKNYSQILCPGNTSYSLAIPQLPDPLPISNLI